MAPRKNNFLNAKPITRLGGASGGVRKPNKPYAKPPATTGKPKLQAKPQKPAAKPARPAVTLPNSRRAGVNLPKVGARVERSTTQGPTLRGAKPASNKPATATPPTSTAAKPPTPTSTKPNPYLSGKPNSNAYMRGVKGASGVLRGASSLAGAALTAAAIPLEIKDMVDRQTRYNREAERRNRVNETGRASKVQSDGRYIPPNQQVAISKPAAKPKLPTRSNGGNPPAPGSIRRQAAPSSGGGGVRGSSTPSRPVSTSSSRPTSPQTSTGTAGKGQQWADFNPNRGTSQTNNPLIKKDDWMMQRMKDREAAQQSGDAQKVGNKFDTKSDVYTPKTKVDGSGLDTKKLKKRRFGTDS